MDPKPRRKSKSPKPRPDAVVPPPESRASRTPEEVAAIRRLGGKLPPIDLDGIDEATGRADYRDQL